MRRVALLALLLVAASAVPAAASPQPTPVCQFCGGNFADAAADHEVNASVVESTAVVRVHENGSATWVVRNRLSNGAERFRESPALLADVARTLLDDGYGQPDGATFVAARMDGDVAVLTYRDPDAADRHAGLLVVEYLHARGYEPWYHVNADEFTIRGPEGAVVTNDPASGRVEGSSVTWEGSAGGELWDAPDLAGSPYVVFGPDRSTATDARTTAALALATLPVVLGSARTFLVVQTALFAALLGIVVALFRRRLLDVGVDGPAAAVAALGAVGVVGPAAVYGPGWVTGPPLFGVGLAVVAWDRRTWEHLRTPRRQALAAGGLLAAVFGCLVALHVAFGSVGADPLGAAFRATALAFPLAAMLPLGGAMDADQGRRLGWGALAVAAFAAVPPSVVDFGAPPTGLGAGIFGLFLVLVAVFAPLVGALVLSLGRGLAASGGPA